MKLHTVLLLALSVASGHVWAKVSECETDCDKNYKYCISSGKGSSQSCRVAHEKCRKACLKKGTAAPVV